MLIFQHHFAMLDLETYDYIFEEIFAGRERGRVGGWGCGSG